MKYVIFGILKSPEGVPFAEEVEAPDGIAAQELAIGKVKDRMGLGPDENCPAWIAAVLCVDGQGSWSLP